MHCVIAKVDIIALDTAHGHSQFVLDAVASIKEKFPDVCLIAGNCATGEATRGIN